MPCPRCGEICRCLEDGQNSAPCTLEDSSWRQEVAARLSRYQARRKPRPPRYPSLRLTFEDSGSFPNLDSDPPLQPRVGNSYQSLALERFAEKLRPAINLEPAVANLTLDFGNDALLSAPGATPPSAKSKIIEFPRSCMPAPARLDELAEPVVGQPRILEAPEFVPSPPALGGITIEPAAPRESERRPGIDVPLLGAPPERRILAASMDALIISVACSLFGFIVWKLTSVRPPVVQLIGVAAGLSAILWAAYQYLLVVYSGATPGLVLARLQLSRFDGSLASRGLRRWRVLASFLSAASLGMGYLWLFLDEDALCWHDRITHTYLAPKKRS